MPEPHTLALYAVAVVVLVAVPGPNLIYIATRSVSEGRRAGIVSVLGVETGTLIHASAAALGLSAVVASSAIAFSVVRYAGAAYLIYLGVRTLLARDDAAAAAPPEPMPLSRAYRQGILVQVLNPKVALFYLAFVPQFVDADRGSVALQVLVFGGVMAVLGSSISSTYAIASAAIGDRLRSRSQRSARHRRRLTAGIYLALGTVAALTGEHRS